MAHGWYSLRVTSPSEDEQPNLDQILDTFTAKVDSLSAEVNEKDNGIRQDLGEVRGGHARNVCPP